jgi:hypothetical protein
MGSQKADCGCSPGPIVPMNKHPAILIAEVAVLWIFLQMVIGKSIWGGTWKRQAICATIAVIVGIMATIFIGFFYK